jgi:acylphosphatase
MSLNVAGMESRAEIVVKGRVQKAGYRDYIDEVAFDLNLTGWVRNMEDGTVKIVCEGETVAIEEFIDRIKIREYPIRVEDAEVKFLPATEEFKDFTIVREEDIVTATYERMDAAGRYMREMNRNIGSKLDSMLEHTSYIPMIEENTSLIPAVREDIAEIKKDTSEVKSHTSRIPAMKEDTAAIRADTREIASKLWEKYEELSKEIAQMKMTLSRIEAKVFG